jgi:quercetin dioxygenase-like cupin family protein
MRPLIFAILLASSCLQAQSKDAPTDIAQVFEPVWQSDKARLFRVTLAAKQSTKPLSHDHDWLLVTLSQGDITLAPEKARSRRVQFEPGHIEIATSASPTEIRNSSNADAQFFLLELAGGIRDDAAACGLGARDCDSEYGNLSGPTYARSPHFDTPTIRSVETTIDPGAELDPHEHPFPLLMVALSDLELESRVEGKQPEQISLKSGEFRAFEGGFTHVLKNSGKGPARLLTLEVK